MVRRRKITDGERRDTDRFALERELRYRTMESPAADASGRGRTLNMSSSGVLFTLEGALMRGHRVEFSVDWPAQLNDSCRLQLVALGKVVRSNENTAAIRFEKYDFRTCGATAFGKTATAGKLSA